MLIERSFRDARAATAYAINRADDTGEEHEMWAVDCNKPIGNNPYTYFVVMNANIRPEVPDGATARPIATYRPNGEHTCNEPIGWVYITA